LTKGEAKINASAIFPYQVIQGMRRGDATVGMASHKCFGSTAISKIAGWSSTL